MSWKQRKSNQLFTAVYSECMKQIAATFVAGAQEIILRQLKQYPIERLKVTYSDDSFILFATDMPIDQIIDFRFFSNTFVVAKQWEVSPHLLPDMVDELLAQPPPLALLRELIQGATFRIVFDENGLVGVDAHALSQLNQLVARQLGIKQSSHRPQHEFWLIRRKTGAAMFGLRLPRPAYKRQERPAGALRPELSHLLLLVAGAKQKDVLLDPFAGYGSITEESVKGFGLKHASGVEKNAQLANQLAARGYTSMLGDATNLSAIPDGSISKVVTDPPWGLYDAAGATALDKLYTASLCEMQRVLRPQGIAVILSGSALLNDAIAQAAGFDRLKAYPILVSGKKAVIHKLQKQ